LIGGQQSLLFVPLVMKDDSDCLKQWRSSGAGPLSCK
jgi:hypothetical protein